MSVNNLSTEIAGKVEYKGEVVNILDMIGRICVGAENIDISSVHIDKLYLRYNFNHSSLSYEFREVTKEYIKNKRKLGRPGFVFKFGSHLYYSDIHRIGKNDTTGEIFEISPEKHAKELVVSFDCLLKGILHKCSSGKKYCCSRLSSAIDPYGCAKTRNFATGIENFDFIQIGYETLSYNIEILEVASCTNFVVSPDSDKDFSIKEIRIMKNSLRDLYLN